MSEIPTRPFRQRPWAAESQRAADAFWAWHLGLMRLPESEGRQGRLAAAARDVQGGERPGFLDAAVEGEAIAHARRQRAGLDLLADQLQAVARLESAIGPETATAWTSFVDAYAGAHACLLGGLAELTAQYQQGYLRALGRAFFTTGRLLELRRDAERGRLLLPREDLDTYGVSMDELRAEAPSEGARRFVWKQTVRARDAFAEARPLMQEVGGRNARALRLWMAGGLEVLGLVERRDYDVWSRPLRLSPLQEAQVRLIGLFGRRTFKSR